MLSLVNNLGLPHLDQGKMAEAEAIYMRTLKRKEKIWGAQHTLTLDTINNLVSFYTVQGKMAEAGQSISNYIPEECGVIEYSLLTILSEKFIPMGEVAY